MQRPLILGLMLLAVLAAPALAGDPAVASDTRPSFEAYDQITDTLTIIGIDAASRLITLTDALGDTILFVAGDEVRNFAQLRAKDRVVTTYKESFSVRVDTAGIAEATRETVAGRAPLGAKPSGLLSEKTEVKATISAIDLEKGTVTLTTLTGEPFTFTPLDPANLETVKVGDVVVFTHTVSTAIKVEKAGGAVAKPAKKAAPGKKAPALQK